MDVEAHAHAHNGIPTTPGAPDLGKQPAIPANPAIAGKRVPLTLLYTGDIHSRVDPFPQQYYHHTYAGKGGFARIATVARQTKKQNPNTLLLDSGDYLQGSPFYNFYKGEVELKALDRIDYDAVTIGNHEFDNGIPALRKVLNLFQGPILTTNVTFSPDMGQRYAVLQAGPLRVGLFALLTEVSGLITPPNFQTAKYYNPVEAARKAVARLQKEADVIVCMSHVGIVPPWSEEDEPAAAQITDETIAQQVPGIDVILSGHTHAMVQRPLTIKNGGGQTLIVAPGYGGGFLGKLDLAVQDGTVVSANNELVPLDKSVPPAADVENLIAPYRAKMDATLKRRLGTALATFGRYSGQDYESSLNNLIADATLMAARKADPEVVFGMSSSGTPRNFIMQGPITVEDCYYALPFDNRVFIVEAKGQVVLDMLATQRRMTDNKRHAIANVTYTLDPATKQISNVMIDGAPFDPKRTYKVAVNDYMADGGSGFGMLTGLKRRDLGVLQRDALIDHIGKAKSLMPEANRITIGSKR
jgi:2',3'-cyclic-nucleotide 2'-phosphodiesterase (5'-nucleotidase family)